MKTNYSHQTKDSLLLEYEYRIEALLNKIKNLEKLIMNYEKTKTNRTI
jgi:hypothetical protein